jgi:hypothetical protein
MFSTDTSAADGTQTDAAKISATGNPFLEYAIERGYDPRKKIKKNARHILLGQAVIAHMRVSGQELVNTPSGAWLNSEGIWSRVNKRWLAVYIEMACRGFDFNSDTKLVNETRAWLLRQPELWRDCVPQSGAR